MRLVIALAISACVLAACVTSRKGPLRTSHATASFSYVSGSFIVVPVTINDSIQTHFVLDTGAGLNVISETLCRDLKCPSVGTHQGKRMSGQEITLPLSTVASLSFANVRLTSTPVGVFDMEKIFPGQHIGGFLSLAFFRDAGTAFTMDYRTHVVSIENRESLRRRRAEGISVPVRVEDEGHGATDVFLPITLPIGDTISVEVDTGSQELILNERFMSALNISASGPDTQR